MAIKKKKEENSTHFITGTRFLDTIGLVSRAIGKRAERICWHSLWLRNCVCGWPPSGQRFIEYCRPPAVLHLENFTEKNSRIRIKLAAFNWLLAHARWPLLCNCDPKRIYFVVTSSSNRSVREIKRRKDRGSKYPQARLDVFLYTSRLPDVFEMWVKHHCLFRGTNCISYLHTLRYWKFMQKILWCVPPAKPRESH